MKSKPVLALPEVADDLLAAAAHYQSWRPDGKDHILQKYEETIGWINWNPDSFPRKHGRIQRAVLKHSYYVIYFLQENDFSLILAVLDGRRNPVEIQRMVFKRKQS